MTLKHFAYLLSDYFKNINAVVGRWGGEEFVAVCYDADRNVTLGYAEDIRERIAGEEFKVAGNVTCSSGITQIKKDDDLGSAFDRMDKALYKAKSDGRNCVREL